MLRSTLLIAIVLLSACGQPDNASGPGGVTVGEAKALDEAAQMIDAQRLPPAAVTGAAPPAPAVVPPAAATQPKP